MSLKKGLHWLGSGLAISGCAFVIYRFYEYSGQIDFYAIGIYGLLAIACLIIIYGIAGLFLARAWGRLLEYLGVNIPYRFSVYAYGTSQLAKYVPGNIFHLAGRQAIGAAAGLPGWPLAKSMFWELVFMSITGSLFAILILPLILPVLSFHFGGIIFVFIALSVFFLIKRIFSIKLSYAIATYIIYLAYTGVMFVAVLAVVTPAGTLTPALIIPVCGAYVIAWLAGLVTPGAPAGIGVREIVLLAMLQQFVAQADLLTAILLGRMVTIGGDIVFYMIAVLFFRSEQVLPETERIKT